LEWGIEDKYWATEGVLMLVEDFTFDIVSGKFGEWGHVIVSSGNVVSNVNGVPHGIGPQMCIDCLWPSVGCM
jgi:hypothetical protein